MEFFWIYCLVNVFHLNYINSQETFLAVNEGLPDTIDEPIALTSSFNELVEQSRTFIDKSLFLREILLKDTANVTLLVCPRKWGKSINLSMIKTFLEIQVYENGKKISPLKETKNYKLFKDGIVTLKNGTETRLRNKLLVNKVDELFKEFLGKYPVVLLDLSGLKKENHQAFIDEFKMKIRRLYRPFRYIIKEVDVSGNSQEGDINGNNFGKIDERKFKKYLRRKATEEELLHSVTFLCEVLKKYFKMNVYILIDEYLTLVYEILLDNNYPVADKEKTLEFYQDFINITLSNNPNMVKAILTGVMRQNSETRFDSIYMRERCFFEDPIFVYYGFQRRDISLLCQHFSIPPKKIERIHRWYGGYRGGTNSNFKIANPWSVAHFIASRDFDIFWKDRNTIEPLLDVFIHVPSFDNALCSLLTRKHYSIEFRDLKYTLYDFECMSAVTDNFLGNKDIPVLSTVDVAFKFLCMFGYLSLNNSYSKANAYNVPVQIPSYELKSSITVKLTNHHLNKLGLKMDPGYLALFENLAVSFKLFAVGMYRVYSQFEASIKNLLNIIPNFTRITRVNASNQTIIRQNEDVLISLFKYTLINGNPSFSFIVSDKPNKLLFTYRHHGVVLFINTDVNAKRVALGEHETLAKYFRNIGMTSCKLLDIFVTYKNRVSVYGSPLSALMMIKL